MDIVYIVRPGDRNEELRYSLRSLANLPHERVWIVGHKPAWVRGVEYIRGNGMHSPQHNAIGNLRLACEHLSQRFVVMNDDFYLMEPIAEVPSWHDGPLAERVQTARGAYRDHLRAAQARLPDDALAWTLHIPVVVERDPLAEVLAKLDGRTPPEWRTMYGNLTGQTGAQAPDVKVRRRNDPIPAGPFLSTSDATFPAMRAMLAGRFPTRCAHEVPA
jgi:hypothetical protein